MQYELQRDFIKPVAQRGSGVSYLSKAYADNLLSIGSMKKKMTATKLKMYHHTPKETYKLDLQ